MSFDFSFSSQFTGLSQNACDYINKSEEFYEEDDVSIMNHTEDKTLYNEYDETEDNGYIG